MSDKFNDFIASSEFIAILDLVAYLGHSLAFRNDMNTRENFLDTRTPFKYLANGTNIRLHQNKTYQCTWYDEDYKCINYRRCFRQRGNSLAGVVVNWNDSNDVDWYEKFITVLNSSFNKNTKIQDPSASLTVGNVETIFTK